MSTLQSTISDNKNTNEGEALSKRKNQSKNRIEFYFLLLANLYLIYWERKTNLEIYVTRRYLKKFNPSGGLKCPTENGT